MLKGIPQSARDSAWHKRHTKRKAASALFSHNAALSKRRIHMSAVRDMKAAEEAYQAARDRQEKVWVGITGWFRYTFSRVWRSIKSVFTVASFHGNHQSDVRTQS